MWQWSEGRLRVGFSSGDSYVPDGAPLISLCSRPFFSGSMKPAKPECTFRHMHYLSIVGGDDLGHEFLE